MEENKNKVMTITKGIFIAYAFTLVLIMIYAVLLAYTKIPESSVPLCMTVIIMSSIFISSSFSIKSIKEKGLINGAIIGIGYVLVLYLLSSIFGTGFMINTYTFIMLLFGALAGIIGGIIGVNM